MMMPTRVAPPGQGEPPASGLAGLRGELARAMAFAGAVTLFINIAMLAVPLYSVIIYDRVMQSRSIDTLTMLTIGCIAAVIVFGALELCRGLTFMVIGDRLARRLNLPALRAALARSLAGDSAAAGQAMRDIDALRAFAASHAPVASLDILWTPLLLLVLFLLHPWYGLYGLLCAGILVVLSVANDLTTREPLVKANAAATAAHGQLAAALRQRELIDGLGMLPDVARLWIRRHNRLLARTAAIARRNTRFATVAKAARLAMQAGVVATGVLLVVQHEASPGSLLGASILMGRLLQPFEHLIGAWRQWTAALASWRRIVGLLAAASPRDRCYGADTVDARLVLDRVTFAPDGAGEPVIEDVSLTLEPGEAVALVGPSGSGKSTLVRLIMGIFAPTAGRVTFGGVATHEWDRAALARLIGYLPQSVELLDGTILDNIARMQDEAAAAAIEAANRAGVHEVIGRLPDGYATPVGDAGGALSGGMRQRIALARALYGAPKLLVLDEPNSNLDHDGEQALIRAIRAFKAEDTAVLIVTHRPSILAAVDRIVTLEHGRIARIATDIRGERPALPVPNSPMAPAIAAI